MGKWCGDRGMSGTMTSTGQLVVVTFRSDAEAESPSRGFKLAYWSEPKGR